MQSAAGLLAFGCPTGTAALAGGHSWGQGAVFPTCWGWRAGVLWGSHSVQDSAHRGQPAPNMGSTRRLSQDGRERTAPGRGGAWRSGLAGPLQRQHGRPGVCARVTEQGLSAVRTECTRAAGPAPPLSLWNASRVPGASPFLKHGPTLSRRPSPAFGRKVFSPVLQTPGQGSTKPHAAPGPAFSW